MDVNSVLQNTRQYFQGIPSSSPATGELAPGASVGYSSPPVSSTATSVTPSAAYPPYPGNHYPQTSSWRSTQSSSQNAYHYTPTTVPATNGQPPRFTQSVVSAPYHYYEQARSQKALPSTSNSYAPPQLNYATPSITRLKEGVNNQGMFNMDSIVCQPNANYLQGGKKTKMKPSPSAPSSANMYKQPTQLEEPRYYNSRDHGSQPPSSAMQSPSTATRVPAVMPHVSAPTHQLHRTAEPSANQYSHQPVIEQRIGIQQQVSYQSTISIRAPVEKSNREPVDARYYVNRRLEAAAMQAPAVTKRDSPLDLSVKTIRQSADSTAHDDGENSMYNHHLQNATYSVAPHQMRPAEARHPHMPQLPYANVATAAVSLPNVHSHSSSAFSATQRQPHYPPANPTSAVYPPEQAPYRVNNGRIPEDRHPVSEYRNEKMTFSFTYEQKQQMHRSQVNAEVSTMRFSQYYQNDTNKKATQQYTSMNQMLPEKNLQPHSPPGKPPPLTVSRKRRAFNETPTPTPTPASTPTPTKNPRVSLEWRENIDKEIENRLNAYTKAREQEEQASKSPHDYREPSQPHEGSVLRSNLEKDKESPRQHIAKLPFTQYLEQHKAQHKLPVQPIQAYPHHQWYNQRPSQYPNMQPYKPPLPAHEAHAVKFNKTSFESKDLKIIEKVENVKTQEQRPLPPFKAFSMQQPAPYSPEERIKSEKFQNETETNRKAEMGKGQSRAALMASALAHPRIRTKAELKQVTTVDKSKDKASVEAVKLPDAHSVQKSSKSPRQEDRMISVSEIITPNDRASNLPKSCDRMPDGIPIKGNTRLVEDQYKNYHAKPPPRLHSRSKENSITVHRRSSETTVFDFRSDSEPENTATDVHTLNDMRKDRKTRTPTETPTRIDQMHEAYLDDSQWLEACDELIQQFSSGGQKKRGRKKKPSVKSTDDERTPKKKQICYDSDDEPSEKKINDDSDDEPLKKNLSDDSDDEPIKKKIVHDDPPKKKINHSHDELAKKKIKQETSDSDSDDERPLAVDKIKKESRDDDYDDDDVIRHHPTVRVKREQIDSDTDEEPVRVKQENDKVNVTLEIRGQRSNVSTTRIRIQNSLEDSSDSSDSDDSFDEKFIPKKAPVKKPQVQVLIKKKKMPIKKKIITRKKGKNIDPKREKMRHMILRRMETRKSKMDAIKAKKSRSESIDEEPQPMMTRKMTRRECQKDSKRFDESKRANLREKVKIHDKNKKSEKEDKLRPKLDRQSKEDKTKPKADDKTKKPEEKKLRDRIDEKPKPKDDKFKTKEKINDENAKTKDRTDEKSKPKDDKSKTKEKINDENAKTKDRTDEKSKPKDDKSKTKEKINDENAKTKDNTDEKYKPKEKSDKDLSKPKSKDDKTKKNDKPRKSDSKPEPKEKPEDMTRRSLRSRNVIVVNEKSPKKPIKKADSPKEKSKSPIKPKSEPKNEEKQKPAVKEKLVKPSWEEELFNYKYSLRMPVKLINISKPSSWPKGNGGASSLPDLDRSESDSDLLNECTKVKTPKKKNKDESKVSDTKEFKDSVKFLKEKFDKKIEEKNKATSLTQLMIEKKMKTIPKSSDGPELLPTPSLDSFRSKLNNKTDSPKKNDSKKTKDSAKSEDDDKDEIIEDSLIGYFRKETVDVFKEVFEKHQTPNQFKTVILESRTRTQTKEMKHNATLKQVFGCDRPASAPPAADSIDEQDKKVKNSTNGCLKPLHKSFAKFKLLMEENCHENEKNSKDFEDTVDFVYNVEDSKDNSEIENVVKRKTRSIRRKCRSSGFDYIRKKKKAKKEEDEESIEERERKKATPVVRPTLESTEDIQNEIRSWVVNKGIGETVLHKAARLGYSDISLYCLEKLGCLASPTDNAGYTPLHEACTRGHLKIAKMLLKHGADVSASAKGGIRPLHEAVEHGNIELVRLLLAYGADPLLSTYAGQTPLSLVKEDEDDLREFLLLYLADIQGTPSKPWSFIGYDVDDPDCGYDPLRDSPPPSPEHTNNLEFEMSDAPLPNLYRLKNEPDLWVLCSDLPLKIRDPILKRTQDQSPSQFVIKKISRAEFDDDVESALFLENKFTQKHNKFKTNTYTMVKYNDKLLSALNIQQLTMSFS